MATYTYKQWIFILGLCYIFYVTLTSEAARSPDRGHDRSWQGLKTRSSVRSKKRGFTGPYSSAQGYSSRSEKPNIILVLTDDQDEMLGSMSTMTKTLKIMAQEGVHFNNSFVSTPMCCPSRSSLLTGMLPHNHHVYTNNENCSGIEWQKTHEPRTFAKYLSDAGYRTGFFGKYLNEYNGTYIPPGWREWVGLYRNSRFYNYTLNFNGQKVKHDDNYYQDYLTDLIANDSVTFLKQSKLYFPTKPVMMMLSVPAPHGKEDAAPQFQHMFENNTLHRTRSWNYMNNTDKQWLVTKMKPMEPIGMAFTDMLQQKRLQTLQSVDSLMEKVHFQLRVLGELDNTYIIYTSDHGYHLGQYGIVKGKALPYDFDIRVPLYIRGPGILRDTKIPNLVGNIDLAPTILDMAGLPIPEHMDGRSMLKLIKTHKNNINLEGKIVETRRPWRDSLLIERGKVTEKMVKILERKQRKQLEEENEDDLIPYASPKYRRTLKVCRDPANQPPCKMGQKWVCFKDHKERKRIKKCRNFNKTVTMDNEIGYQKDSPYGPSYNNRKPCLCPDGRPGTKPARREYVTKYQKKRSLRSYEDEEMKLRMQLIAQQLNSNRQKCRFYPNDTFACDTAITKDPRKYQNHKIQLDEMIAETKRRLRNLKKIRKNLKKQKKNFGKEYTTESNKSDLSGNTDGYSRLYNGQIEQDCDCDEEQEELDGDFQIPPALVVASTYEEGGDSAEDTASDDYNRYHIYDMIGRRGHGREAKNCNHDELKCTVMSNDHWQTPPYWRLGDYCFCNNAVTNTYWCMRTINETSNFLYCEFIDSFLSYYDFITDPHQLENKIKELSYGVMQQLHEELTLLRQCSGWKQCNKNTNKKHTDISEKRRRRRRKVRQQGNKRHRPTHAGHRRNIAESQV